MFRNDVSHFHKTLILMAHEPHAASEFFLSTASHAVFLLTVPSASMLKSSARCFGTLVDQAGYLQSGSG